MNKVIYGLLASILALGLTPNAQAYEVSATYTGASPAVVGLTVNSIGFGGARFAATATQPLSVAVTDASSLPVFVVACQDTNGDSVCNSNPAVGPVEPRASGCGTVTLGSSFIVTGTVIVFVYGSNIPGTTCTGLATTGTITVTYANPI